jgi:hypothetical protein
MNGVTMPQVEEVPLDFENLAELDNHKISMLLTRHLALISQDCINRPGDKTKRKVVLEFYAEPTQDDDGSCDGVHMEIECRSKVPTFRSKRFMMKASRNGFLFNRDFPDAIDQPPLFPQKG